MILVTGVTGNTGGAAFWLLMAAGARVRVMARDVRKIVTTFGADAEVVQGDFADPASLGPAMENADKAFLVTPAGPDLVAHTRNFLDAAKGARLEYIVRVSSAGAAKDSPVALGRWHAEADALLAASGIPYTVLRPGYFMQNLLAFAPSIAAQGVFRAPLPSGRVALIDARDIGAVGATVLLQSGQGRDALVLTGPEAVTFAEVAAKLSAALGRPVRFEPSSPDETRAELTRHGAPSWLVDDLLTLYAGLEQGWSAQVSPDVQRVLNRPGHTVEEFARDHTSAFGAR